MTRVMVTGANGFIGTPLVRALVDKGFDVIALEHQNGDISAAKTWSQLPEVEHVFHLAARSYVPDAWCAPSEFMQTNIIGTSRVLDYCRERRAHLVFVSAYLYGIPRYLPIAENHPIEPNNPYALSKYMAEQACAFHNTAYGLPVTVVRPFNVYGPRQRREFLIPEVLFRIRQRVEIRIKDVAPRRDYVYLDDLVDALVKMLSQPDGYRIFNIGSGISYSVGEMIDMAQAIAHTRLPVVSGYEQRRNEIFDVRADISAAQAILGWNPSYSLADGLAKLILMEQ